jgi:RNA 3'-terminal phosphate cyclase (ATP)
MALAKGTSSFKTTQITDHLLTNLWVIHKFLEVKIQRWGKQGEKGTVEFLNK